MSENKKRFNPWILTVILGVVAVLFSFYALQVQTELQDAREEAQKATARALAAEKLAIQQLRMSKEQAAAAQAEAERIRIALQECEKSGKKNNK